MASLASPREGLVMHHTSVPPTKINGRVFEATTDIGLRPTQEDRLVVVPSFYRADASFCGVFDGTVGDHAAEYVAQNIVHEFCSTDECRELLSATSTATTPEELARENEVNAERICGALRSCFLNCDRSLLAYCAERNLHYASSTGVAVFLWQNILTIAHIGDSKGCIAKVVRGEVQPEWLTIDHKPHLPAELQRIEQSGGSLAWLHGNKPFIRGGDFTVRQAAGEHPKQLNYSRAFGGKDLKMYGLSAEPDISNFEVSSDDKLLLIASDGLWDVLSPRVACDIALRARQEGRSGTADIVRFAIEQMPIRGVRDNITVIAIFLNDI